MGTGQSQLLHRWTSTVVAISDATSMFISSFKFQLLCLLTDTDKEINHILGKGQTLCLCKITDILRTSKEL